MKSPDAALRRLIDWFRESALPLWAARGYDAARGGFYESLDFQGAPVTDAVRRVRVQARQIHVFAETARLGWSAEAAAIAKAGFDHFLARACPDAGERGCVHLLAPDNAVEDDRRDLYDQAFLILAGASTWRAFADRRAHDLAERVLGFLDRELATAVGGYAEDDRGTGPRRQNPHMHLFEACMAFYEASGEPRHFARAGAMADLFEQRFFDSARGVLREYLADDLTPASAPRAERLEPGHMAEWVWLLDRYAALGGRVLDGTQQTLLANAEKYGRDPRSGFLVDVARPGAPAQGTRRLWPQTEYLRACLVMARKGDAGAARRAGEIADALFASYLDQPVGGLWCDQFDETGRAVAKDVPASILYHLFEAARVAERYLGDKGA